HQNPQLSRGCEDYTVVVDNLTVSFPVPVSMPVFKAFNDTEAAVNCSLPQVIAYGTHVSNCTATDAELGTVSSCTFSVIVKECRSCSSRMSTAFERPLQSSVLLGSSRRN
ncbi:unnamed protein product, partial [Ixodes persulcatus]